ncbi:50S ribosomal protein L3 [bacterium]|nr:50S ribosomal protein L3 [bacterium]
MKFILGRKIEMAQIWKEGKVIPVTLIEAGPCWITQIKTKEKDKYQAYQVGFLRITKENKIKKSQRKKPFKFLREFRVKEIEEKKYKLGDKIDVSIFQEGDKIKVSGISKGKGFQGVVKRWGFSGRGASHGVKHEHRTLGSVGSMFPQRVVKGKKMPGRMGGKRTTVKNLEVVMVDKENNLLGVKGAVPGRRGTLLEISNS